MKKIKDFLQTYSNELLEVGFGAAMIGITAWSIVKANKLVNSQTEFYRKCNEYLGTH